MKIEEITLRHIQLPFRTPWKTSKWTNPGRESVIVEIRADGFTGWGECAANRDPDYCYESMRTNWYMLHEYLGPIALATPLQSAADFTDAVAHLNGHPLAKAGLEMAVWDLLGQRAGRSLQSMLGGAGDRVKVGVSIGIHETPSELLGTVDGFLEKGFRRVKLKIAPGRDIDHVAAVRRAHPDLLLQADANSAYSLDDTERLRRLDEHRLLLLEQPLAADDIIDHATLQSQLETPVCLDESIHSEHDARKAIGIQACRIINIKPSRLGGLHQATRVHDRCRAAGVPVWMGGMMETGIGRAANLAVASLPGFTLPGDIPPTSRHFARDLIETPFELHPDGTMPVPQGHGLGVRVDRGFLDSVTRDTLRLLP